MSRPSRPQKEPKAGNQGEWRPSSNPWIIAVVVTLGAFMEVLDTTIVNVSLPHISGTLGVSYDEATWTLTSYLVANGIVLTISGWLSKVLGRKRYFLVCVGMFTLCSFLCGIATSLPELIVFRLLQGLFGGGLQPSQQAIILDTFAPSQRSKAFAVTAIATVVAPILGPTLGGFLTDTYSWRWVFLINVPVGIFTFFAVTHVVEDAPWSRARGFTNIDYVGLSLITLGLGCLEVMVDRGEDAGWFSSHFIQIMGCLAALGLCGAIAWLLYTEKPVVDIRVMADRNFALGSVCMAGLAAVLYGSAVIIPQLAQQQLGYTATWSGLILSPGGVAVVLLIPLVGRMMGVVGPKYIVSAGFLIMGFSLLYSHRVAPNIDFTELAVMRTFQAAGLAFLFVPISVIAFMTLPKSSNADGSALFTMFRNVFGSLAISLATAMVTERSQARQAYLVEHLTPLDRGYNATVDQVRAALLAQGNPSATTMDGATGWILRQLHQQAAVLAYSDVFLISAGVAFAVVPLTLFLSNKKGSGGGAPAH